MSAVGAGGVYMDTYFFLASYLFSFSLSLARLNFCLNVPFNPMQPPVQILWPTIGNANSVSGRKLHYFKIVFTTGEGGIRLHPPSPLCVRACVTRHVRTDTLFIIT